MDSSWRLLPCHTTELWGHTYDSRPGTENRERAEIRAHRKSRAHKGAPQDDRTEVGKSDGYVSRKAAIACMAPVP